MSFVDKAQADPYFLAVSMNDSVPDKFWVVHLSCGIEIYQSLEDPALDEPNAWMRLKQFCADQNVKIVNMARACQDLNPSSQINLPPMADGYFYSKRIRKLMSSHPTYAGYQDLSEGLGSLDGDILKIVWCHANGCTEIEERCLSDYPKSKHLTLIR